MQVEKAALASIVLVVPIGIVLSPGPRSKLAVPTESGLPSPKCRLLRRSLTLKFGILALTVELPQEAVAFAYESATPYLGLWILDL